MYSRCMSRSRARPLGTATVADELGARGVADDASAGVGSALGVGTAGALATIPAPGVMCDDRGRTERGDSTGLTGEITRIRMRGRAMVRRGAVTRGRFGNLDGWYWRT